MIDDNRVTVVVIQTTRLDEPYTRRSDKKCIELIGFNRIFISIGKSLHAF